MLRLNLILMILLIGLNSYAYEKSDERIYFAKINKVSSELLNVKKCFNNAKDESSFRKCSKIFSKINLDLTKVDLNDNELKKYINLKNKKIKIKFDNLLIYKKRIPYFNLIEINELKLLDIKKCIKKSNSNPEKCMNKNNLSHFSKPYRFHSSDKKIKEVCKIK